MSTQKNYENIKKLLKNHHQSHLLAYWNQLDKDQRQDLLAQIQYLDLAKIDICVKKFINNPASGAISGLVISLIVILPNLKVFGFIPGWAFALAFLLFSYGYSGVIN